MAYDEKCLELAKYFLKDRVWTGTTDEELAQVIQDAIEDALDAE